jgi:3-hydroxy-9,10-secoandrosta-1,3,5(10)-triene-9,17-dione monooxygenase reductase component
MEMAIDRREGEQDESLLDLLARANHLLTQGFCDQVRERGISTTEWRILAALWERDGAAMTELAEQVLFKQPTLTKAIDRMERAQLVQRRTPSEDRRRTLVYLTERGRQIAAPLQAQARQHELRVRSAVGDAESRGLRAALLLLIARLEALPAEERPSRARRAASD